MKFESLASAGFPNYRIFENGDVMNVNTQKTLKVMGKRRLITLSNNGYKEWFYVDSLKKIYFPEPWIKFLKRITRECFGAFILWVFNIKKK